MKFSIQNIERKIGVKRISKELGNGAYNRFSLDATTDIPRKKVMRS